MWMTRHRVRTRKHNAVAVNGVAAQLKIADGEARYDPGGGIQPHRLFDHHFCVGYARQNVGGWRQLVKHRDLVLQFAFCLRVLCQQEECPGEGIRRCLVPGDEDRHGLVAKLLIAHMLAMFQQMNVAALKAALRHTPHES